jgi:hypothetical protein
MFEGSLKNPFEEKKTTKPGFESEELGKKTPELSPEEKIILANAKKQVNQELGVYDLPEQGELDSNLESIEADLEMEEMTEQRIGEQIDRGAEIIEQSEQERESQEKSLEGRKVEKKNIYRKAFVVITAMAIAAGSLIGSEKDANAGDWERVGKCFVGGIIRESERAVRKEIRRGTVRRDAQDRAAINAYQKRDRDVDITDPFDGRGQYKLDFKDQRRKQGIRNMFDYDSR